MLPFSLHHIPPHLPGEKILFKNRIPVEFFPTFAPRFPRSALLSRWKHHDGHRWLGECLSPAGANIR